ncbi:MAG: hypothetical protein Q9192_005427, partial [Flavoplaca navasiana]
DNLRRRRCHRISPSQIITSGFTHLYFAFASIDPKTFEVVPAHPEDVRLYGEFTSRKTSSMQTWITLGGFTFSSADATRKTWSMMASRAESRKTFITSLGNFMKRYGFQGVELDWEYPSTEDRGGSPNDAANLVGLVREMRTAWNKDYGISATLPPDAYLRGFDAKGMEQYIDFFNYLSYDLRAPLSADSKIAKAAAALWKAQVDPKKVNLGLSKAGRGYTLSDTKCAQFNCKVSGPSKPGPCTNEAGLLSNTEISDVIQVKRLKAQLVPDSMSKEVSWDNQWIGYDDDETFRMKTEWAAENCFGGTTLWSLDMDSGEGRLVAVSGKTPVGAGAMMPSLAGSSSSSIGSTTASGQPMPIAPAPKISIPPGSTSDHSSIKPGQQGVPLKSPDPSIQTRSTQSPKRTSSATFPGSTVSRQIAAAVPNPTIAVGAIAVSGLVPLGVAIQKGLSEGQKATTNLAKSSSPKAEDVTEALGILAGAYAGIQILDKQARMLDINKIPPETKAVIEKFKISLPSMLSGTKDTITHLTDSIKDPAKVKKDDVQKAEKIMGEQGSVFKQSVSIIKPLVDWKVPKGVNDITLPGILTLKSPTIGDGWKGTTIPGTLTIPSPSITWDAALLPLAGAGAGEAGAASGGKGGGKGNGGVLSGLLSLAKQAETAVHGAADAMNSLSNLCQRDEYSCPINFKKLSDAVSQLTSATEDVGGLGAGLDIIEMDAWPPADVKRVFEIRKANRGLFNGLKDILSDVAQIIQKPQSSLPLLMKHRKAFATGGSILALLAASNEARISSLPTPKPRQPLLFNATEESKKDDDHFFIVTVQGTTVEAYLKFIEGLPDKGTGEQRHYEWPRRYQTYLARMTEKQAQAVNGNRLVDMIGSNRHTMHDEQFNYQYEKSCGKGTTVYVLDSGFNFEHEEFDRGDKLKPEILRSPKYAHLSTDAEHGDAVAAMAVGKYSGVANQAKLVVVKYLSDDGMINVNEHYDDWRLMISHVQRNGLSGKAVINYSLTWFMENSFFYHGWYDYSHWGLIRPTWCDLFIPLLVDCWASDIVTVVAAGNRGSQKPMGSTTPQRYANPNNALIVVGSVDADGFHSDFNSHVGPWPDAPLDTELVGDISIYALGQEMNIIDAYSRNGFTYANGTSFAAPQIAGLAAYFLALPGLPWTPGSVSYLMKTYLLYWRRQFGTSLDGLDIAYNGVWDILKYCEPDTSVLPEPLHHRRWLNGLVQMLGSMLKKVKRQNKGEEKAIFENGHLRDSKYSNEFPCKLPGGVQPKPTFTNPATTASQSKLKPTTSAIHKPAQPKPTTSKTGLSGPGSQALCYSDPKYKKPGYSTFHGKDMSSFINTTCSGPRDLGVGDDGNHKMGDQLITKKTVLSLSVKASKGTLTVNEKDCLNGFHHLMKDCDKNTDKKYGGEIQVGGLRFRIYAAKQEPLKVDSKPSPKAAPPPAPVEDFPAAKDIICYSEDNEGAEFHSFGPFHMYTFINRTCESSEDQKEVNAFSVTEDGKVTLQLSTSHQEKSSLPDDCIHGFTTAVDNCDKNAAAHYGGQCNIGPVSYHASAANTDLKPKNKECYKKSTNKKATPFKNKDIKIWIKELCEEATTFTQTFTRYDEPGHKPIAQFNSDAVEGKMVVGFDKAFCVKGYETIVDDCNKGKDKEKEDLWGGEVTIGDINFTLFPPSPPKEDKPKKED